MFRAVEKIESLKSECFNLDYFIENMYINKDIKLFNDNKKIISNVKKHLTNICYKKRLNPSELRKGDYYILSTERQQRTSLEMNNYTNQFLYSFPLVGTAEIMDYANSIPHEEKLASKYQMKFIKELYPSLLEIPFFTYQREKVRL